MRLQGKTAIITDATSGMGKAMSERFVSEGASVILSGRDELRGKELEKKLIQLKRLIFLT
ncbi:SDR family NAD(P)-dependent oxidoreductase [Algoriphagus persicinus]|uniref:SDR family NAD(P)-dependent oxidoreductase n=1 Tax=Algoriphagus persicinus TaxID=3108754 RepID=UPI002B3F02C9|nr:SDR family NAD(P)-dependent oxidoreductase [Algoriphagus sp. E1-3-M2]MEB2783683.1 SDR family NAD(P)-dependent oxidoreductase [Algoriphagus sp. E1-3-M2]